MKDQDVFSCVSGARGMFSALIILEKQHLLLVNILLLHKGGYLSYWEYFLFHQQLLRIEENLSTSDMREPGRENIFRPHHSNPSFSTCCYSCFRLKSTNNENASHFAGVLKNVCSSSQLLPGCYDCQLESWSLVNIPTQHWKSPQVLWK